MSLDQPPLPPLIVFWEHIKDLAFSRGNLAQAPASVHNIVRFKTCQMLASAPIGKNAHGLIEFEANASLP